VHAFFTRREVLAAALAHYRVALAPSAVVWVSWPKKSSRLPTDITEDVIRTSTPRTTWKPSAP
jgi:hypothetical protein